jgi:ATP-dependent Clp protease adaptor protein ClpS
MASKQMTEKQEGDVAVLPPETKPAEKTKRDAKNKNKPQKQPPYNVIIWNDEEHTYEYVIELLMKVFKHDFETAFLITDAVHHQGRGIALTTHKELAELKRDQVLAYGPDWRMPKVSKGSIRATIEPAA